jgi:hypothetical protein
VPRLHVTEIVSVGLVDAGDNPEAEILFFKRQFTAEERKAAIASGAAMPDGSFPILNRIDLRNAVQALGLASRPGPAKKHIISRARALDAVSLLPDSWEITKSVGSAPTIKEQPMADDPNVEEVEKTEPAVEVAETAPVEVDTTQEIIAKLRDENKATADALASEIRKRREVEAISKAREAGWDEIGKAAELGPAMARAETNEATAADIGLLTRTMTAAAQAIELGAVFIEKGSTEGADNDPIVQRDAFVKAHPDLSLADSRAQFWAENPEMVEKARQN